MNHIFLTDLMLLFRATPRLPAAPGGRSGSCSSTGAAGHVGVPLQEPGGQTGSPAWCPRGRVFGGGYPPRLPACRRGPHLEGEGCHHHHHHHHHHHRHRRHHQPQFVKPFVKLYQQRMAVTPQLLMPQRMEDCVIRLMTPAKTGKDSLKILLLLAAAAAACCCCCCCSAAAAAAGGWWLLLLLVAGDDHDGSDDDDGDGSDGRVCDDCDRADDSDGGDDGSGRADGDGRDGGDGGFAIAGPNRLSALGSSPLAATTAARRTLLLLRGQHGGSFATNRRPTSASRWRPPTSASRWRPPTSASRWRPPTSASRWRPQHPSMGPSLGSGRNRAFSNAVGLGVFHPVVGQEIAH